MKNLILSFVFLCSITMAAVPDPVITTLSSVNGYVTIAGRLTAKPNSPVGISVENGNLMYSTITDLEGRWAIVIRHLSTQANISSWSLTGSEERGKSIAVKISKLPWSRTVSATGSSNTEMSAKYQTDNSLRSRIDQEQSSCRFDKGDFYYSGGSTYCYKSGINYNCSASATCYCR